ncbi:Aste57867_2098 [Aphanomyces stellatus]|uniref:Aste57867_2098 protein n=1 Tax=Aphanomyces stellatus TaxID=120398 RepID=A0A485K877_9STRA|nr:hypothetical protein As57867_002093 [Aphanomyces stellatus]VFT79301.1 Aste57867_2098 [Aphanomyces stellatus]
MLKPPRSPTATATPRSPRRREHGAREIPERVCGLSPTSWLRRMCIAAFFSKRCHLFMYFLIVANAVALGFEPPTSPNATPEDISRQSLTINWIEFGFNVVFTIELAVKLVAGGVRVGPHAYFRHRWNYIDCTLVILGWISCALWMSMPPPPPSLPSPTLTFTMPPLTDGPLPVGTGSMAGAPTIDPYDAWTPWPSSTEIPPADTSSAAGSFSSGGSMTGLSETTLVPDNTLEPSTGGSLSGSLSGSGTMATLPPDTISPDATIPPDIGSGNVTVPDERLQSDDSARLAAINCYKIFRLLRVFKVLRGVRLSKYAQALVQSLFDSTRLLLNVLQLLLVVYFVFAVAGVNLFKGALHAQCNNEYGDISDDAIYINADPGNMLNSGNGFRCSNTVDIGRACSLGGHCLAVFPTTNALNKNPNYGFTSFDNVGLGLLTVIEIASLADWGSTMWNFAEARGLSVGLFFLLLVPLGGYFVVNLVIAVVHNAYTNKLNDIHQEIVTAKLEHKQKSLDAKKHRHPSIIDLAATPTALATATKNLPVTELSHLELKELVTRFRTTTGGRVKYKHFLAFFSPSSGVATTLQTLRTFLQTAKATGLHARSIFRFIDKDDSGDLTRDELVFGFTEIEERVGMMLSPAIVESLHDYLDVDNDGKVTMTEFIEFADPASKSTLLLERKMLIEMSAYEHAHGDADAIFSALDPDDSGTISVAEFRTALARLGFGGSAVKFLSRDDARRQSLQSLQSLQSSNTASNWSIESRRSLAMLLSHAWVVPVVVNLALVGQVAYFILKTHGPTADPSTEAALVILQPILHSVFVFEMALKVAALGLQGYLVDRYHLVDGALSIVGLADMCISTLVHAAPPSVDVLFCICRALRLLQLFRQWPTFRVLVETMLDSFRGLLHFAFLVLTCMYIFALVGMHLFGLQMIDKNGFPTPFYTSFDNVGMALLTVFQVFSGDSWTDILYACMRVSPISGALYVVVAFFTGNYLVLNVFLSILLQGFDSSENEHHTSYMSTLAHADIEHYYRVVTAWLSAQLQQWTSSSSTSSSPGHRLSTHAVVRPFFSKLSSSLEATTSEDVSTDDADERARAHEIADILLFKMDTHTVRAGGAREFYECFHGFEAVHFLLDRGFCKSVVEAEALGNRLLELERFRCHASTVGRHAESKFHALLVDAANAAASAAAHDTNETESETIVLGLLDDIVKQATDGVRFGPPGPFGNHTGVFSVHATPWRKNINASLEAAKRAHHRRHEASASSRHAKARKFLVGRSMGVFGPTNWLRRAATTTLLHPAFKYAVLVVVLASCVLAGLEVSDSDHASFYLWADVVISGLFFIEMAIKMIAQGVLVTSKYAYLRNGWNILDGIVAVSSVLTVVVTFVAMQEAAAASTTTTPTCDPTLMTCPALSDVKSNSVVKAFRLFRALRPLRAIHLNPFLKAVVKTILITLPCVLNLLVVLVIFVFLFAAVAYHTLAGKMMYCAGNAIDKYTLNQTTCISDDISPRSWEHATSSFESLSSAIVVLLEITTLQGWSGYMYQAMDAPNQGYVGAAPGQRNSPEFAFFFLTFVVICGFFMLGLFLGIIVYKFAERKAEHNGTLFITDDQKKWVATQRRLFAQKPKPVKTNPCLTGWRRRVFAVVVHRFFDPCVSLLVFANVVVMATDHFPSTPAFDARYSATLVGFTCVFGLELVLQVVAFGPTQYIVDHWFDFAIWVASVVDSATAGGVPVLRVARLLRVVHLVQSSKYMASILKTLTMSLPALLNVASLLLLVAFAYAILGMNLFYNPSNPIFGTCLRDMINFDSLATSMMVLFVVVTGDNWACYMHDVLPQYPLVGRIYFSTFLCVGNYIILNLLVAIVMDNFGDFIDGLDTDAGRPANVHLDAFAEAWRDLAPPGSLFMPSYKLVALLHGIPTPLGFKRSPDHTHATKSAQETVHYIRSLHARRSHVKEIFYLDVFYTLCHHAMPNSFTVLESADVEAHIQAKLAAHALRHFRELHHVHLDTASHRFDLTEEFNSARVIQAAWRRHWARVRPARPTGPTLKTVSLMTQFTKRWSNRAGKKKPAVVQPILGSP